MAAQRRGAGQDLLAREYLGAGKRIAACLRRVGRVQEGALLLDLRCLEDEAAFLAQLEQLDAGQDTNR